MSGLRKTLAFIILSLYIVTNLLPQAAFAAEYQSSNSFSASTVPLGANQSDLTTADKLASDGEGVIGTDQFLKLFSVTSNDVEKTIVASDKNYDTASNFDSDTALGSTVVAAPGILTLMASVQPVATYATRLEPIDIVSGFNADIVASGSNEQAEQASASTTQAMRNTDGLPAGVNPVWFTNGENGFVGKAGPVTVPSGSIGVSAMPNDGKFIGSPSNGSWHTANYQLQPYNTANALVLKAGSGGTLTFKNNTPYCELRFLYAGNADALVSDVIIHFTDGSTREIKGMDFNPIDSTVYIPSTYCYKMAAVQRGGPSPDSLVSDDKLTDSVKLLREKSYSLVQNPNSLSAAAYDQIKYDYTKSMTSVEFTNVKNASGKSGGEIYLLGVSGMASYLGYTSGTWGYMNFSIDPAAQQSSKKVTVSWRDIYPIYMSMCSNEFNYYNYFDTYVVELSKSQYFTSIYATKEVLKTAPDTDCSITDLSHYNNYTVSTELSVEPNTTYYARVYVKAGDMRSDYSTIKTFKTYLGDYNIKYDMTAGSPLPSGQFVAPATPSDTGKYLAEDTITLATPESLVLRDLSGYDTYTFKGWKITKTDKTTATYQAGADIPVTDIFPASGAAITATAVWVQDGITAPSGDGSSGNPYLISSAEDLRWVGVKSLRSTMSGKYFKQTADITYTEVDMLNFPGIGCSDFHFAGIYDGNSKKISGLAFKFLTNASNASLTKGLFNVTEGATIKNIVMENCSMTSSGYKTVVLGLLVGDAINTSFGSFSMANCSLGLDGTGSTDAQTGTATIGGAIGKNENISGSGTFGAVTLSKVTVTSVGYKDTTTGILIGYSRNITATQTDKEIKVADCSVTAAGVGAAATGANGGTSKIGLLGEGYGGNLNTVFLEDSSIQASGFLNTMAGGMVGFSNNLKSKGCITANGVAISVSDGNIYAGGHTGKAQYLVLEQVVNRGNLSVTDAQGPDICAVGGLVGYESNANAQWNHYRYGYNCGSIRVTNVKKGYAGGIFGYINSGTSKSVLALYNAGTVLITGTEVYGGGILGFLADSSSGSPIVTDCFYIKNSVKVNGINKNLSAGNKTSSTADFSGFSKDGNGAPLYPFPTEIGFSADESQMTTDVDKVYINMAPTMDHSDANYSWYFNEYPTLFRFDEGSLPLLNIEPVILPVEALTFQEASLNMDLNEISSAKPGSYELSQILTITPEGAKNATLLWTSADEEVATVSSSGRVTAVGPGETDITVAAKMDTEKTATIHIKVDGVPVSGIEITDSGKQEISSIRIPVNDTVTGIKVAVLPADATIGDYTLVNSSPGVVTVTKDSTTGEYTLKGLSAGKSTITVVSKNLNKKAMLSVTVEAVKAVSVTLSETSHDFSITDYVSPNSVKLVPSFVSSFPGKEVTFKRLSWSSSDNEVATVSANGTVYAVGMGDAVITGTTIDGSNITVTCTIHIAGKKIEGLQAAGSVNPKAYPGSYTQLTVKVQPTDALNKKIVWSSSDTSVATVDQSGAVRISKKGAVTITATSAEDPAIKVEFKPDIIIPVTWLNIANNYLFQKMSVGKTRQMNVDVYPTDADSKAYTFTSSDPSIASVDQNGNVTTHKVGQVRLSVTANDTNVSSTTVLNVLDGIACIVTVKNINTGENISGAVLMAEGESYPASGQDGKIKIKIAVDDPDNFLKIEKSGYRVKQLTQGSLMDGAYTVYLTPDNGEPYFSYIGNKDSQGQYHDLQDEFYTSSQDEISSVYLRVEPNGKTIYDVFITRGPNKIRVSLDGRNAGKTQQLKYYETMECKANTGMFYATMTTSDKLDSTKPLNFSSLLKWDFMDYNEAFGNIKFENAAATLPTSQSSMFNTGFNMQLPDGLPVQISVQGSKVYMAILYDYSTTKGPNPGDKFTKNAGAMDFAKEIKNSMKGGAMTDKLKEMTKAPPTNKLEKRINATLTIMGYMEANFVTKKDFVDISNLEWDAYGNPSDTTTAISKLMGISTDRFQLMKTAGVNFLPVTYTCLEVSSSGFMIGASGSIIYGQQFMAGPVPVYVELNIGAALNQYCNFVFSNGNTTFGGKTEVLPFFGAYAAVGLGGVFTIGPTLGGSLPITVTYPDPVVLSVKLNMNFGLKVQALFYTKKYNFYDKTWTLFSKTLRESASAQYAASSSYYYTPGFLGDLDDVAFELVPRDYTEYGSISPGTSESKLSSNRSVTNINMTSGYPELMAKLVPLDNDKRLLVWEDDDLTRGLANRTVIKYSVFNGTVWSSPAALEPVDDGTPDGKFSVASSGSKVYVVYENAKTVMADTAGIEDLTGAMEIRLATYDADTGTVTSASLSSLTEQKDIEANMNPKIAVNGDNVSVAWLNNSANDLTGATGTNTLRYASVNTPDGIEVSDFVANAGLVLDYSLGFNGGQAVLAYMTDDDGDFTSMNDRSIWTITEGVSAVKVIDAADMDVSSPIDRPLLATVGGVLGLYWYQDGNINYLSSLFDKTVRSIFEKTDEYQRPATPQFDIVTAPDGQAAIVYTGGSAVKTVDSETDEVSTKQQSDIYAVFYNAVDANWDGFRANLTKADGSAAGGLFKDKLLKNANGFIDSSGTLYVAASQMLEDDVAAALKVITVKPQKDIAVEDDTLLYNPGDVYPGATINASIYVKNVGELPVRGASISLADGDGNTIAINEADTEAVKSLVFLPDAEAQRIQFSFTLPKQLDDQIFTATVLPLSGTDCNESNNEGITRLGCVDLSLASVNTRVVGKYVSVSGSVLNSSTKQSDTITVSIRAKDVNGDGKGSALWSVSLATLAPYEEEGFSFDIDTSDLDFTGEDSLGFVIEADSDKNTDALASNEVFIGDNTDTFTIQNAFTSQMPFSVSASGMTKDTEKLSIGCTITNNLPVENSGTLSVSVYDANGQKLSEKDKAITIGTVGDEIATVDFSDASVLEKADFITAVFTKAAQGSAAASGVSLYSNMAIQKMEDFVLSSVDTLDSLTIEGGKISPEFNKETFEYRLGDVNDKESLKILAAATDETGALITYAVNNGDVFAVNSDEKSDGFFMKPGDKLKVTVRAVDGSEKVYTVTYPENSGSGGTEETGADILINGKVESTGKAETVTNASGQKETTVFLDSEQLMKKLDEEGNHAKLSIRAGKGSAVVAGELNGQMVKRMENKEAVLEIVTGSATYTIPAQQINIDGISSQLGSGVELADIKVRVEIATSAAGTVKVAENSAQKGNFTLIAPPVDFSITCTSGGKTVEISKFNGYVERTVVIPDGIDPSKITTGVVLNNDGTFSHVPTLIVIIDGKYYAKINSMTNSTYTVIYNLVEFSDVTSHWAMNAINDMGSRLIVTGVGNNSFDPNRDITRAEFTTIIVQALGLRVETGVSSFSDVAASDWFGRYIKTAAEYKLVSGYSDGTFRPNAKITREEAMAIIARAMKQTGLKTEFSAGALSDALKGFVDAKNVGDWAADAVGACVLNSLVTGKEAQKLAPKDEITRAEVAVITWRLLKASGLI